MLLNFERTDYDVEKAVKLEMVKIELFRLSSEHYKRTLLSKGLFALTKIMILARHKGPDRHAKSTLSEGNSTLHRLLDGVIAESRQSELEEFVQIEKSLETEISETLTSEPDLCSNKKPPLDKRRVSLKS